MTLKTYTLSLTLLLSISAQTFSMQPAAGRMAMRALQQRACSTQAQTQSANSFGKLLWWSTKRLALFSTGYAVGFTNGISQVFNDNATITSTIDGNTQTTTVEWKSKTETQTCSNTFDQMLSKSSEKKSSDD